jgi:SWI/SNF-related matrix-associated actin-dependent regulator of chromatin subfamily A member 5
VAEEVITKLHKVLRPFLLRRVKGEVETDLPPKREMLLSLGLSEMQREQYKNILRYARRPRCAAVPVVCACA